MIRIFWFLTLLYFVDVSQSFEELSHASSYDHHEDYIPYHRLDHDDSYHGQHHYHSHHDYIDRPCNVHDVKCIQQFFTKRSHCTPVHGPSPDPYFVKSVEINLPSINATGDYINNHLFGLNSGEINEFYIDKKTNVLVLEVIFKRIIRKHDTVVTRYHRNGEQPVVATDYVIGKHNHVSLTLTIVPWKDEFKIHSEHSGRKLHELPLKNSHVYSHLTARNPHVIIGPKMLAVERKLNLDRVPGRESTKDVFVELGELLMAVFIQSQICDFRNV